MQRSSLTGRRLWMGSIQEPLKSIKVWIGPFGGDHTELGQVTAERLDGLGALANQQVPRAEHDGCGLRDLASHLSGCPFMGPPASRSMPSRRKATALSGQ